MSLSIIFRFAVRTRQGSAGPKISCSHDQRLILLRLAKVSHADEDMDFVVREGGDSVLTNENALKAMLGSIRKDPENLFRFPNLTFATIDLDRISSP